MLPTIRQKPSTLQRYERCLIFPFFPLPQELRDMIYHEIWKDKPAFLVRLPYDRSKPFRYCYFAVSYNTVNVPYTDLSRPPTKSESAFWFLTSRQMLAEAMNQFHRVAVWSYISDCMTFPIKFSCGRELHMTRRTTLHDFTHIYHAALRDSRLQLWLGMMQTRMINDFTTAISHTSNLR